MPTNTQILRRAVGQGVDGRNRDVLREGTTGVIPSLHEQQLPGPDEDLKRGIYSGVLGIESGNYFAEADRLERDGDIRGAMIARMRAGSAQRDAADSATRVSSFDQVRGVGDGIDFVQGQFGAAVPSLAASTVPAIAGGIAGGIVGGPVGATIGAGLAGGYPGFQLEKGEAASQQQADPFIRDLPVDVRIREQNTKAAYAMIPEILFPAMIGGRIGKTFVKQGMKAAARSAPKTLAMETFAEGATEGTQAKIGQGSLNRLNPNRDRTHDTNETINSILSGMIAGGGVSTITQAPQLAGSAVSALSTKRQERQEAEALAEPFTENGTVPLSVIRDHVTEGRTTPAGEQSLQDLRDRMAADDADAFQETVDLATMQDEIYNELNPPPGEYDEGQFNRENTKLDLAVAAILRRNLKESAKKIKFKRYEQSVIQRAMRSAYAPDGELRQSMNRLGNESDLYADKMKMLAEVEIMLQAAGIEVPKVSELRYQVEGLEGQESGIEGEATLADVWPEGAQQEELAEADLSYQDAAFFEKVKDEDTGSILRGKTRSGSGKAKSITFADFTLNERSDRTRIVNEKLKLRERDPISQIDQVIRDREGIEFSEAAGAHVQKLGDYHAQNNTSKEEMLAEAKEKVRLIDQQIADDQNIGNPIDARLTKVVDGKRVSENKTWGDLAQERTDRRLARKAKLQAAIADPNSKRLRNALNEYGVVRMEDNAQEGMVATEEDMLGKDGMRKTVELRTFNDKLKGGMTEQDKIAQQSAVKIRFKKGHKVPGIQKNELILPTLSVARVAAAKLAKSSEGGPIDEKALREGIASVLNRRDVEGLVGATGQLIKRSDAKGFEGMVRNLMADIEASSFVREGYKRTDHRTVKPSEDTAAKILRSTSLTETMETLAGLATPAPTTKQKGLIAKAKKIAGDVNLTRNKIRSEFKKRIKKMRATADPERRQEVLDAMDEFLAEQIVINTRMRIDKTVSQTTRKRQKAKIDLIKENIATLRAIHNEISADQTEDVQNTVIGTEYPARDVTNLTAPFDAQIRELKRQLAGMPVSSSQYLRYNALLMKMEEQRAEIAKIEENEGRSYGKGRARAITIEDEQERGSVLGLAKSTMYQWEEKVGNFWVIKTFVEKGVAFSEQEKVRYAEEDTVIAGGGATKIGQGLKAPTMAGTNEKAPTFQENVEKNATIAAKISNAIFVVGTDPTSKALAKVLGQQLKIPVNKLPDNAARVTLVITPRAATKENSTLLTKLYDSGVQILLPNPHRPAVAMLQRQGFIQVDNMTWVPSTGSRYSFQELLAPEYPAVEKPKADESYESYIKRMVPDFDLSLVTSREALDIAGQRHFDQVLMAETAWMERNDIPTIVNATGVLDGGLVAQLQAGIKDKPKKDVKLDPELVAAAQKKTSAAPTQRIPMYFKDGARGNKMRPEFRGKSTLDLIQSGDRTATTRRGQKPNVKKGDIVTFFDYAGNEVQARITKAPYPVSEVTAEQWSKLEGWSAESYKSVGWQYQYEKVSADQSRAKLDPKLVAQAQKKTELGPIRVTTIISGGQTGGDLGGLMAGQKLGLKTGGTAPRYFQTEVGNTPKLAEFGLAEITAEQEAMYESRLQGMTNDRTWAPRTMANVDAADATIAFLYKHSAGTGKTIGYAQTGQWKHGTGKTSYNGMKPVLVITSTKMEEVVPQIQEFLRKTGAKSINIAGHRESSKKGLTVFTANALTKALQKQDAAAPTTQSAPTAEETALSAKLEKEGILEPIPQEKVNKKGNLCLGTCSVVQQRLVKTFGEKNVAKVSMSSLILNNKGELRSSSRKGEKNQTIDHYAAAVKHEGRWYLVDHPQTEFSHAAGANAQSLTATGPYQPRVIPMRDIPALYGPQSPVGFHYMSGGEGFGLPIKQLVEDWKTWIPSIYASGLERYVSKFHTDKSPVTGKMVHKFIQRLEQKLLDNGVKKADIAAVIKQPAAKARRNAAQTKIPDHALALYEVHLIHENKEKSSQIVDLERLWPGIAEQAAARLAARRANIAAQDAKKKAGPYTPENIKPKTWKDRPKPPVQRSNNPAVDNARKQIRRGNSSITVFGSVSRQMGAEFQKAGYVVQSSYRDTQGVLKDKWVYDPDSVRMSEFRTTGLRADEDTKRQVRDTVVKILGDRVTFKFVEAMKDADGNNMPGAGRFRRIPDENGELAERAIEVANTAVDPMSVGFHEAFHALMSFTAMMDGGAQWNKRLIRLASTPAMKKQLRDRIIEADGRDSKALIQLEDPQERITFMFQFAMADPTFKIKPEAETMFQALRQWIGEVLGFIASEKDAQAYFDAFAEGKFAQDPALQAVLDKYRVRGAKAVINDSYELIKKGLINTMLTSTDRLRMTGIPALMSLADKYYTDPNRGIKRLGVLQATRQRVSKWRNELNEKLEGHSKEEIQTAHRNLQAMKEPSSQLEKDIDAYLKKLGKEAKEAGVTMYLGLDQKGEAIWKPIELIDEHYYPRKWEAKLILDQKDELKLALQEEAMRFTPDTITVKRQGVDTQVELNFDKEAAKASYNPETMPANVKNADEWMQYQYQMEVAKAERPRADEAAHKEQASSRLDVAKITDQAFDYWIERMKLGDGMVELDNKPTLSPQFANGNMRAFNFIEPSNAHRFVKYQAADPAELLTGYTNKLAHRIEHTIAFGPQGQLAQDLIQAAKLQGATQEQLKMAEKAVQALDGTLGTENVKPWQRDLMVGAMSVVNFAVLPLALFSSLVDPLGVMVRTGSMRDAWTTYKAGAKHLYQAALRQGPDEATKLARLMGIISDESMLEVIGNTDNGMFMNSGLRKLNSMFFNIIGLEPWTNGTRVGAMLAGMDYLSENATDTKVLDALGLQEGDVQENETNGFLKVSEADGLSAEQAHRMQEAMFRFVDSAILRPNAAQRPIWMSDLRFIMIGHLKQFTFSFHNTILKQIIANSGDAETTTKAITAFMPLLAYIPVMMAADGVRDVLAGRMDDDDDDDADLAGYMRRKTQRSAVLGIGTFGFDLYDDMRFGGLPLSTFAGPVADQSFKLAHAMVDTDRSFVRAASQVTPFHAFTKGWTDED